MPHPPTQNLGTDCFDSLPKRVTIYDSAGFPIDTGLRPASACLPVVLASDQPPIDVTVGGTVAVDGSGFVQPTTVGNFPSVQPVSGTFYPAVQPVSGSVSVTNLPTAQPVTDAQLRAGPVAVSGAVVVSNFPASQAVSGAFFQATQPVSVTNFPALQAVAGPLTDTQLRTAAVPVSGTFFQATQPVSVTNFPATQAVGAAALPLPLGASTSALQTAANASLSSIDTKLTAPIIVRNLSTTGTGILVSVGTSSVQILPANAGRKGLVIVNPAGSNIFIGMGFTPTSVHWTASLNTTFGSDNIRMFELVYTGAVFALRQTGTNNVSVTEFT